MMSTVDQDTPPTSADTTLSGEMDQTSATALTAKARKEEFPDSTAADDRNKREISNASVGQTELQQGNDGNTRVKVSTDATENVETMVDGTRLKAHKTKSQKSKSSQKSERQGVIYKKIPASQDFQTQTRAGKEPAVARGRNNTTQ